MGNDGDGTLLQVGNQKKKGIHKLKPDVLDFQIFQGVQGLGSLSWIQKIQGQ